LEVVRTGEASAHAFVTDELEASVDVWKYAFGRASDEVRRGAKNTGVSRLFLNPTLLFFEPLLQKTTVAERKTLFAP
jgi:hypothetical protein